MTIRTKPSTGRCASSAGFVAAASFALAGPFVATLSGCRGDTKSAWKPAAPQELARLEGPGAVVSGRLFVFGGFYKKAGRLKATQRVDAYDPRADRWQRRSDMPVAVTHVVAAVDGKDVWFAGGFVGDNPGVVTDRVHVYDAHADTWSEGPALPAPRAGGVLIRNGRTLHYFSGFSLDRDTTYGDHWVLPLDGEPHWQPRAPLPSPRGHLAGAALGGEIYAIGGQFNHDNGRRDVAFVHAYDPAKDSWREVEPLPKPVSHAELSIVARDGRIYVFGGRRSGTGLEDERIRERGGALSEVSAYDPESNRWMAEPELPTGLIGSVVVEMDGSLVLTGGSIFMAQKPQTRTYRRSLPMRSEEGTGG